MVISLIMTSATEFELISIPFSEKFDSVQFSTINFFTAITRMPFVPRIVPAPLMEKFLIVTDASGALIIIPFVPLDKMEPITPPPSMVIDFEIVTAPKPPGSRILISPPAAVLTIAPASVLQGAVRLQGFTSSPTPETQVRVACERTGPVFKIKKTNTIGKESFLINLYFRKVNSFTHKPEYCRFMKIIYM